MIRIKNIKQTRTVWNKGILDKNKYQTVVCLCGKNFKSYISSHRKYCSHNCFIKFNLDNFQNHRHNFKRGGVPWNEGLPSWNRGLTKDTNKSIKKISEKLKGRIFSKEWRNKLSLSKKNIIISEKTRLKQQESRKRFLLSHPEMHPNILLAKRNKLSKPQQYLFKQIKKVYPQCTVYQNFQVRTLNSKTSNRFIDVAIPRFRIGFEYDSKYWHQDIEKDKQREDELKEVGWNLIHIRGKR